MTNATDTSLLTKTDLATDTAYWFAKGVQHRTEGQPAAFAVSYTECGGAAVVFAGTLSPAPRAIAAAYLDAYQGYDVYEAEMYATEVA